MKKKQVVLVTHEGKSRSVYLVDEHGLPMDARQAAELLRKMKAGEDVCPRFKELEEEN